MVLNGLGGDQPVKRIIVDLRQFRGKENPQILEEAGFSGRQRAEALGNIIGRMCAPRSELATAGWLKEKSALGELFKHDFTLMPLILAGSNG